MLREKFSDLNREIFITFITYAIDDCAREEFLPAADDFSSLEIPFEEFRVYCLAEVFPDSPAFPQPFSTGRGGDAQGGALSGEINP